MDYLKKAIKLGIDAVIISDPGLLVLVRKVSRKIKIHLSTQANTINSEAVKFWQKQGVSRIVLGRELSLKQVRKIRNAVPKIELELFVHGAMCMSYSGRCLLSKHMLGRSANRGECAHPCRWQYRLKEMERPDEEFSIEEDARGTYVMNSKDLCMIEHIPKLVKAGINSFKIEGRMKSAYYVALVTKIYRQAINAKKYNPLWKEELLKVAHRNYTTGFYLGEDDMQNSLFNSSVRNYAFVGVVVGQKGRELEVKARNYFAVGDELEVIDPAVEEIRKIKIAKIRTAENWTVSEVHNDHHVFVEVSDLAKVTRHSLLRKKALL